MWQKIFKSTEDPQSKSDSHTKNKNLLEPKKWSVPTLRPQDIRVLVCQDPGDQNKTALFDSDQLTQVNNSINKQNADNSSQLEISSNTFPSSQKSPLRNPRRYNLGPIGDMMFGTVPMSFKGTTTKLHTINGPQPQLLLTLLFSLTTSEIESILSKTIRSIPIINPSQAEAHVDLGDPLSYESKNSELGNYSDDHSEDSNVPDILSTSVASSLSSFHNIHLDRRLKKAGKTSLENGAFSPTILPSTKHDDYGNINRRSRHTMFSIGIVIEVGSNRHLRDFLHSHYSLIEIKIHKLYTLAKEIIAREFLLKSKSNIGTVSGSNSIFNSKYSSSSSLPAHVFLDAFQLQSSQNLLDQVNQFREELISLYTTPRIQEPLWLNILSLPNSRQQYTNSFIQELSYLISNYDTKKTNYFISGLLSNILSNHLSWVPVVPANSYKKESLQQKLSYNPLWAQLSDLYGNVGCINQISRTIVVGQDKDLVSRILFVLTYFIRCNEIVLSSEKWSIEDFVNSEALGTKSSDVINSGKKSASPPPINQQEQKQKSSDITKGLELTSLSNPEQESDKNLKINTNTEKESVNQSLSQMIKDTEPRSNQAASELNSELIGDQFGLDSDFVEFTLPQGQVVEIFPPPSQATTSTSNIQSSANQSNQQSGESEELSSVPDTQFLYTKSYGRSLMSSYCNSYKPDFILLGVPRFDFIDSLENDLKTSVQFSYDEPVKKAICIVADTNTWQTHLIEYDSYRSNDSNSNGSSFGSQQQQGGRSVSILRSIPSDHILETLQETHQLSQFGMPSESCVQYLEDRLRQLYYKSILLSSVLRENQEAITWDNITLANFIGVQASDINIILSIASTYDPLTKSVLNSIV